MLDPHDIELPLTARATPHADDGDEAIIRELVDAFYDAIRDDEVLGPIFMSRVQDWTAHLTKMYDFWSTIVLRTGRYTGRPIEVHARIPDLDEAHFKRWLGLWATIVSRYIPEPQQDMFLRPASRMAYSLSKGRERT